MKLNPLDHPVCLEMPLWLEQTAWAGHLPFAMFLISALRPRVFVELGVDRGTSYCTFCQAVRELELETKCFGVDTWRGDEHAGERADDVLVKLRGHHDPLYSGFSNLLQSTFEDGLQRFDDASIDLLHIDGFHTYEAVENDFRTWLPKMSERGIVVFHDTAVRERGFGVWKFWSEVKQGRPSFEFDHSHGLGVLAVGEELLGSMRPLFEANRADVEVIRKFFQTLGDRFDAIVRYRMLSDHVRELQNQAEVINASPAMKAYRRFKQDGVGAVIKRIANRQSASAGKPTKTNE